MRRKARPPPLLGKVQRSKLLLRAGDQKGTSWSEGRKKSSLFGKVAPKTMIAKAHVTHGGDRGLKLEPSTSFGLTLKKKKASAANNIAVSVLEVGVT